MILRDARKYEVVFSQGGISRVLSLWGTGDILYLKPYESAYKRKISFIIWEPPKINLNVSTSPNFDRSMKLTELFGHAVSEISACINILEFDLGLDLPALRKFRNKLVSAIEAMIVLMRHSNRSRAFIIPEIYQKWDNIRDDVWVKLETLEDCIERATD